MPGVLKHCLIAVFVLTTALPALAQEKPPVSETDAVSLQANKLEAELGKYNDNAPEAAEAMAQLVDLYHQHARMFGLIRIAQRFISNHTNHPRHESVMLKLMDGLQVTSRNKDLIIIARQYLVRYPQQPESNRIALLLAKTLDENGEVVPAAQAYRDVWKRQPNAAGRDYAVAAIERFSRTNNAKLIDEGGQLAKELLEKFPAGRFAEYVGWKAFYDYRRTNQYAAGNAIGNQLLKLNLPEQKHLQWQLHYEMSENYASLQQYANSVESLKKAQALHPNYTYHQRLIERMSNAQMKPEEMQPVVDEFVRKYPQRPERFWALSTLAQAYFRVPDNAGGARILRDVLQHDARVHGNSSWFVRANGSEPANFQDTERVLLDAIQKNEQHRDYLRYSLAAELYRDRMKDEEKTRQTFRQLLAESPGNDGYSWHAVEWLLYHPKDEAGFQQDVALAIESRRKFAHLSNHVRYLPQWIKQARGNKDHRAHAEYAQAELDKANQEQLIKTWEESHHQSSAKAAEIREQMLANPGQYQLTDEQTRQLWWLQGFFYQHYSRGEDRPKAVDYWGKIVQKYPRDFDVLIRWLQVASDYGQPEAAKETALHFMKQDIGWFDPDWQRRLMICVDKSKDAELAKQTLAWINQQHQKYEPVNYTASYIGDVLTRVELKDEALVWWKKFVEVNPWEYESRACVERLVQRMAEPQFAAEKQQLLQKMLTYETDYHGLYASWLADEYLKTEDWANFEKVLREATAKQKERPFHGWEINGYIISNWVNAWKDKLPPEKKEPFYQLFVDLNSGWMSGRAALEVLALKNVPADGNIQELLKYQRITTEVEDNYLGWDQMISVAQQAMADSKFAVAATLLTGSLANIPQVDDNRKQQARDLVAQSYARLGAVGLTIDENSPVAPLMQAALYLRLGDENLALQTYLANRALFNEHRSEVPVDLLLFAAEHHTTAGGDENYQFVEDILRGWQIKNNETKTTLAETKAKVQLLLAKNFFKAQRFDVARSEFTTLINLYPELPEALEAEFGIGETFMAQKVYDQAELVFEKLANRRETDIVVRAEFLRGVLAYRRGDKDEARDIFRVVLERVPSIELANKALYNLAEVYGDEERYIEQLNLLRTVGRLGRNSKRFHRPGTPLSIVVQDSDLGISRGHNRIPVIVTTVPGGDKETAYLVSGGAGKGLFRVDLETRLGPVTLGNKVLELTGKDVIKCDYPEEFKAEFRNVPLSDVDIRIASNGEFQVASSKIVDEEEESFSEQLQREAEEARDQRVSQGRPVNQIKPGNLVYLKVDDPDRDVSNEKDTVVIKFMSDSGDQVQLTLTETGEHTGIFEGTAKTGELPAGALASDTSIEHSPLMAIDQNPESHWLSEPDGATPKFLTIDMKDLKTVDRVRFSTPKADNQAPVRGSLFGSNDGRFWFRLVSNPPLPETPDVAGEFGPMTQRLYSIRGNQQFPSWNDVVTLSKSGELLETAPVETLDWTAPEMVDDTRKAHAIIWQGQFVQERPGAIRFAPRGHFTALQINGNLELPPGPGNRNVDVWVERGVHQLTIFASAANSRQPLSALRARADNNVQQVLLTAFRKADFDLTQPAAQPEEAKPDNAVVEPIQLTADAATFEKTTANFGVHEANKNKSIGYWQDLKDAALWEFNVPAAGVYEIWLDLAHEGEGGQFSLEVADQKYSGTVPNTGNWSTFRPHRAGVLEVAQPGDFKLAVRAVEIKGGGLMDLRGITLKPAVGSLTIVKETSWDFRFKPMDLRYVKFEINEYLGEAVAISQVEVFDKAEKHIPTATDVLSLAENDVLEIAGGDTVTAGYTDEFTESETGTSRLLESRLTATYYNAEIRPIAYDFVRDRNGAVTEIRKELIRIEPGERFIVEIIDYDMDQTDQPDEIKFQVMVNGGEPLELTATETEPYSGRFTKEVDTSATTEKGKLTVKSGDRIFCQYLDQQNTFPGHSTPRETIVYVNQPSDGKVRIYETRLLAATKNQPTRQMIQAPKPDQKISGVAFGVPLTVEVIDPDAAKDELSSVVVTLLTTDGSTVKVRCQVSTAYGQQNSQAQEANWALLEGRFIGQIILQLGGKNSPTMVPLSSEMPRDLIGGPALEEDEKTSALDRTLVTQVLNVNGTDTIAADYADALNLSKKAAKRTAQARLLTNGKLLIADHEYKNPVNRLHVGEKLFLLVEDADRDQSDERDTVTVEITSENGEKESVTLAETTGHSGIFTGSFTLKATETPTAGNFNAEQPALETYFGDTLRVKYVDTIAGTESGSLEVTGEVPVVIGTDGLVAAFSKTFNNEVLAVETQFHIAESYFELFKSHRKLGRQSEEKTDLEAGRRILREVMEDYPDPKYVPRIAYLLGQFAQELAQWNEAIESYKLIVRQYPDHTLAADAQFKLAQCYEEAGNFDQALEEYVTLAATYPKSPLIANVMIRISDHFYKAEKYDVAAQVGEKFLERFEAHQHAAKMAFRIGQCHYKAEKFRDAGEAFDRFVKTFPEDELTPQALFWAGESYRMGRNIQFAFQRYNRCRWDFPSSEAAQFARGRLTLPEMLSQFQSEVNSLEDNN